MGRSQSKDEIDGRLVVFIATFKVHKMGTSCVHRAKTGTGSPFSYR
jgi:hypothetical protein